MQSQCPETTKPFSKCTMPLSRMLVNKNFSHIQLTVSKERRGKRDDYAVLRRRNQVKDN